MDSSLVWDKEFNDQTYDPTLPLRSNNRQGRILRYLN